jgi:hypothetical protein
VLAAQRCGLCIYVHRQGITDLEGCMQQVKDMLNVNNSLVFSLKDIASASSG